jgi:hypothetical protein
MISYSTRQRELALRVRERLSRCSGPRIDCLDIAYGAEFREQLAWWLSYCHAAVVLLSADALASPWVRYELSVLANRVQLDNVILIPLLVGGLTPEQLAARADLAPLALANLHGASLAEDAGDDEIDKLIERVAEVTYGETAIERLVQGVNGCLVDVRDTARLARARERLRSKLGGDGDPWFDDPRLADIADQGVRLRWALAAELCATPIDPLYDPLEELAQAAAVPAAKLDRIVDLSVMAVFDSASTAALRDEMDEPDRGIVLGCATKALCELAPDAALQVHPGRKHRPFWLHEPLTGACIDDYVDQIEQQLRLHVENENGDFDKLVARKHRHPLVVLLSRADGLTPPILAALHERLPRFSFVVLPTETTGPDTWSSQLGGLPVAGPHPAADGWPAMRAAETRLVDEWCATKWELRDFVAGEEAAR